MSEATSGWSGRFPAVVVAARPRVALVVVALAALVVGLTLAGTGYTYHSIDVAPAAAPGPTDDAKLRKELAGLQAALRKEVPGGMYIVVDRTNNRLYLRERERVLLEAKCSAGSGRLLRETGTDREWEFHTPRGEFKVRSKIKDPVWKKPDWAFVEEGKAIPKNPGERIEYGVLGEYGLYFGDGYLIHGTLYERLLGRNVSHGCIRLGREDLRRVYRDAKVGTPIFIY